MKKQFILNLLLVLFLLAPAIQTLAQNPAHQNAQETGTWHALGTLRAARMGDHDELKIAEPHAAYTKIKLKVTDAPLNLKRILIHYDDGQAQSIDSRYEIKNGGESNTIDLMAGTHKLKSIELWYDTQGLIKGKAHVTVYGMK